MKKSRLDDSHPVTLYVQGSTLFDDSLGFPEPPADELPDLDEVVIQLVVVSIRVIYTRIGFDVPPDDIGLPHNPYADRAMYSRWPEYEVDGWLDGPQERIWVRCVLHTNDTENVEECIVYRLEPGEELGTDWTPGMSRG